MLSSILSFKGFLTAGAFASIMDSNSSEIFSYVFKLESGFFLVSFLVAIIYLIFTIKFGNYKNKKVFFVLSVCIIMLLCFTYMYKYYTSTSRSKNLLKLYPFQHLSIPYQRSFFSPITNYLGFFEEISFLSRPPSLKLPEHVKEGGKTDYRNIILILGESASRRHYSHQKYKYSTTPLMERLEDDPYFHWVEDSISSASITRESVKNILSFSMSDSDKPYHEYINIVNAAKLKGFKTFWLSTQGTKGIHNSAIYNIGKLSDYSLFGVRDDLKLPSLLLNEIEIEEKQFFILHLSGSHRPYDNYFKKDYERFLSLGDLHADYDATIKKTDTIINEIVNLIPEKTLLIYLSDHGEVIGKGHGLNEMSQEQFDVPFIIYDNSGNINNNINIISEISNNGVLNTEMTMEFVMMALGYEVKLDASYNPFIISSSNGGVIDYRGIKRSYYDD